MRRSIKISVSRILGDGKRQRTHAFTKLVSHYLFQEWFGRLGKGNDKGKVEALVKYSPANFLTPVPHGASFDTLNAALEERCRALPTRPPQLPVPKPARSPPLPERRVRPGLRNPGHLRRADAALRTLRLV
jgi:hypothetical protein